MVFNGQKNNKIEKRPPFNVLNINSNRNINKIIVRPPQTAKNIYRNINQVEI